MKGLTHLDNMVNMEVEVNIDHFAQVSQCFHI